MKKLIAVLTIIFVTSPGVFAEVSSLYESKINVYMTVTDIGGGVWQYDFNFTNTDTTDIWHFGIYTSNAVSYISGSFNGVATDSLYYLFINGEYDSRNVDSKSAYYNNMWTALSSPYNGLVVGGSGSLSFQTDYTENRFMYFYETSASGWAVDNGGKVAAVGYTIPQPSQ